MENERGSTKLIREHWQTRAFKEEHIMGFLDQIEASGIRITDWFPLGTPRIDVLQGGLLVEPDNLGALIDLINQVEVNWRVIKVFPKGTPRIDLFDVQFEATPGFRA